MKFGDSLEADIVRVDKKGRGIGKVGSKTVAAPFAVPGERIRATVTRRDGSELRVRVDELIVASPHRVKAKCSYAGKCGGCAWQQFDYAFQLEMKRGLVNEALEAAGLEVRIEAVMPAPSIYYYRNRMDYCVGWKGEIGLKEPGRWNAYLDLKECHLLSPQAPDVLQHVRDWMAAHDVKPWDAKSQTGYVRYVVVREGKRTGKRMVTLVTSVGDLPAKEDLVARLSPLTTTLYHGVNPLVTDLSIVDQLELLHGEEFLTETVCGKTFRVHPNAFFQTNTEMAEKLVETVRGFFADAPPKTLLDLYCGGGLFGICLSDAASKVVGVEVDPRAIESARVNAAENGITNATYHADKTEGLVWKEERPDAVIIDPPRAGLHPKVVETLLENRPQRIAYVSCNYESFCREMAQLGTAYRIEKIEALDLFPHSPHVELAALLSLRA